MEQIKIIGNASLFNGIPVYENIALPSDRLIHDTKYNIIHIPEDGTIYKLIFGLGLTNKAINDACKFALNKVKLYIDEKYK